MTAFCGLSDPLGNPIRFPEIQNNGSRAEAFENWVTNQDTYSMYLERLLDIAMSVFEWKNLPKGVDQRQLEWWLMTNGYALFFYDPDIAKGSDRESAPEGFAVLQCMLSGQWNMYNLPRTRTAYAVDGYNGTFDESNSVIIFNNYLRSSMYFVIRQFAWRLANIERSLDVNVGNQKTTKVLPVDERNRLSVSNVLMDVSGGKLYTLVDKKFDMDALKDPIDLTVPLIAEQLQAVKHQIWNEALTYLGVENVNTEKKERLISDEVFSNMGDVEAQRFTRLNARKKACDEINRLFGLDVDVDFRSGIYIHADGYGAQEIPTSGMQDSEVLAEGAGYDSNDSGILTRIRALLGV